MLGSLTRSTGSHAANLRRATGALVSFIIAVSLASCARQESSGDLSEVTGYWRGVLASQNETSMELVFRID